MPMRVYTLRCEMMTQCSLEETFAVFENPYNLAKITPPQLKFQVSSKQRVQMRKGAEIEYTIRWMALPMHWKTLIVEYQPPHLFVDEQARGPYRLWRHRHTFERTSEGIRIGDQVDYALPFGFLGRLVHALAVRRQLMRIFNYRQRELGKILGGGTVQTLKPVIKG